ncbi:MAG: GNAT family N-acetyltransferase [Moraxellaceae bacterium]
MNPVRWRCLSTLRDAPAGLFPPPGSHPFTQNAFLSALEDSGAVGPRTAWQPCHLLLEDADTGAPLGLLPLYRKTDSRGEYVFDQAWAQAWHRHGLRYYPKLVSAIPFTPVPGPRLLLAPAAAREPLQRAVLDALPRLLADTGCSGWHGLFVEPDWLPLADAAGLAIRLGCRFHWHNPGWRDFEDYLAALTSKKRKDIRRERRRLAEDGIRCRRLSGPAIDDANLEFFIACYARTYHEHGQAPYLPPAFFRLLRASMPEQLLLVVAEDDAGPLAAALFLRDACTLYGRYWGALRRADGLHFEACYYQGMEFCLAEGLADFDPGTQGEHKLLRGFRPRLTHSLHWVAANGFREALSQFVREEARHVSAYCREAETLLPYRQPGK